MALNYSLLRILGLGWLSFLLAGIVIARFFSLTQLTVLVDRSKCDRQGWREVSDRYADLYKAHERKRIKLSQVVIVSELGEEIRKPAPTPQEFQAIETIGAPDTERFSRIRAGFAEVEVLACGA
jgi:hypothetical protein